MDRRIDAVCFLFLSGSRRNHRDPSGAGRRRASDQRKQHPLFQLYHDVDPDLDHGRHPSGRICGYGRCDFFLWGERKKTGNPERPTHRCVCGHRAWQSSDSAAWMLESGGEAYASGDRIWLCAVPGVECIVGDAVSTGKERGTGTNLSGQCGCREKKNDRSPGSLDHRRCGWYVEYRRQCRNPCGSDCLCNLGLL